jgi:hypothetical protein
MAEAPPRGGDELAAAEVEEVTGAVEAGTDGIDVPAALLVEPEAPAATQPARSLYAQILGMRVEQKIKLALRGNKDARMILIHDRAKLIRRLVLQNPRISEAEVVSVARNRSADDELLRVITDHRDWMRNYQVRQALVTNPKTPLPIALRQVATLIERDLRLLARSKNVPEAVTAHARRLLLTRGRVT